MLIQENFAAPDFTLADENGDFHKLSDYLGKSVILYFYPADDTSGCTTEACNFRDDYSVYQKAGVVILGVSPDSSSSHTRFKAKYTLPFTLLADEDHQICQLYGVWGLKNSHGNQHEGVFRTTYLISPEGKIRKVFENVKPADHSAEVLAAL